MNDISPDSLLGYTLNLGGLGRRRLEKALGGGATAVVFLGVSPDMPEDRSEHVAVKVARPDPQWRAALETEWENLKKLEEAEKRTNTHYFPRVLWPEHKEKLQVELYMRPPGRDWGYYPWVILVQELVRGQGVHDLVLDYPGLRLPEPLALAIAAQYVEMLTILHGANLTCADRKLADLRWEKAYALQPGDAADLARWRTGERPGTLMVLDWNVTGRADSEHVAFDLFHFGVLWHRLLLGTEPRFRLGEWRLEEPLHRHPYWQTLSAGTQQIVNRLFYPQPERRYRQARSLLEDITAQAKLWQQPPEALWEIAGREGESLERRWAAVDLLDTLAESWGVHRGDFPDFGRRYNELQRALEKRPFQPLQDAFNRSDWETALAELERLARAYEADPARLLQIERYRRIIKTVQQNTRPPDLSDLWAYAGDLPELAQDKIAILEQRKDQEHHTPWGPTLTRLWAEALYYPTLRQARELRERGDIRGADAKFADVLNRREDLRESKDVLRWLDDILGNPEPEAKAIHEQAEMLSQVADRLQAALNAVVQGVSLEDEKKRLDSAFRSAPGEIVLGRAHRLLLAEEAWRRVEHSDSPAAQILALGGWWEAWCALAAASPAGNAGLAPADWDRIKDNLRPALDALLHHRRDSLRQSIIEMARLPSGDATAPPPAGDRPSLPAEPPPPGEGLRLLVAAYRQAFPEDRENLDKELKAILEEYKTRLNQQRLLRRTTLQRPEEAKEHYEQQKETLRWAYHGQLLAAILDEPWPAELAPEAVVKHVEEAQGCLVRILTALGRYFAA